MFVRHPDLDTGAGCLALGGALVKNLVIGIDRNVCVRGQVIVWLAIGVIVGDIVVICRGGGGRRYG